MAVVFDHIPFKLKCIEHLHGREGFACCGIIHIDAQEVRHNCIQQKQFTVWHSTRNVQAHPKK